VTAGLKASGAAALMLLCACTMEPHYEQPKAPVPPAWTGGVQPGPEGARAADIGWGDFFPDPALQQLITQALARNRDLRVATLNVEAAQAQYRIQRADLLPSIAANGVEESQRFPSGLLAGNTPGKGQVVRTYEVSVGFTSYELDLFGRIRSLKHQALAEYLSTQEAQRSAQITLIAEVASAYYTVIADETILGITRQTLESQSASYKLIRQSLDAGATTSLVAAQAATTVDTARANLAAYTRQAAQDRNTLMLLIGGPLPQEFQVPADLDAHTLASDLPAAVPSRVLTARPDVMAAEHQLIAANANIGAARAAFFPSIKLTGSYGTASPDLSGLFKSGSEAWVFSPQISLPIFTGGANRAGLDLAKVQKNIAVAQYEKTLQIAFKEVDDALAARATLDEQLAAQQALLSDATVSDRLADMRFKSGVDSFLPALDAQRVLYAAQQSVVTVELMRLQNLATLYKALGGGEQEASVAH
jgi:outer membrane protein, multidrug efflux system